jgi:hypothetical protein
MSALYFPKTERERGGAQYVLKTQTLEILRIVYVPEAYFMHFTYSC